MKKTLLALAMTTLVAPVSAYEIINNEDAYLNFYGEIKARALILENQSNDYTFGDSRIGVDARYAATDTTNLLALVEGEVNFDADEERNEDDVYFSQAYLGVQHEVLGQLTFGDHSTASDDLDGIDYSEAFGDESNLNPATNHETGLKYTYDTELFTVIALYGSESGDQDRELQELFGEYKFAEDMRIRGGFGNSSTNVSTNKKDVQYMHATFEMNLGDVTYGATYYYSDTEDKLNATNDVSKNALALAAKMEVIEKLYGYVGFEHVYQSSDADNLDGNLHNLYLGSRYEFVEWANVFAEVNYFDDETSNANDSEVNFAVGATVFW